MNNNFIKLAIISPGFMPVPAVKGGAVEQIITCILEENEKDHKFNIDVYTLDDSRLSDYSYKYTKLIKIKNKQKNLFFKVYFGLKNRICKLLGGKNWYYLMDKSMAKMYKSNYYDVVLFENNMNSFHYILPKLTTEKRYFHLHNDFNNDDKAKSLFKTKEVIKNANGMITVSNVLKEKLKYYGAKNVTTVYNPDLIKSNIRISNEHASKIRQKYGFDKKDIIVTYIGRLDKSKGPLELLKAMSEVKNPRVKCLIVGKFWLGSSDGRMYSKKIQEYISELGDKVKISGYVKHSKINEIYAISDIVVIPTQIEEAFGMVALEAVRSKVPVIASDSGALPEILGAKDCIIKRNGEFVCNLAKEIDRLASDRILRKKVIAVNFKYSQRYLVSRKKYFEEISKVIQG